MSCMCRRIFSVINMPYLPRVDPVMIETSNDTPPTQRLGTEHWFFLPS